MNANEAFEKWKGWPPGKASHPMEAGNCDKRAFLAGHSSRDAEVAELKKQCADAIQHYETANLEAHRLEKRVEDLENELYKYATKGTLPKRSAGLPHDVFKCKFCGCEESWFDRTLDEKGDMNTRCSKCGRTDDEAFCDSRTSLPVESLPDTATATKPTEPCAEDSGLSQDKPSPVENPAGERMMKNTCIYYGCLNYYNGCCVLSKPCMHVSRTPSTATPVSGGEEK